MSIPRTACWRTNNVRRLLFPLEALDEGEPLLIELCDKDFAGTKFMGQVPLPRCTEEGGAIERAC